MTAKKWFLKNTSSLEGKRIAVTGTTGGLGRELCIYLASLGASLVLMDRNAKRSEEFRAYLEREYGVSAVCIGVDLEELDSVKRATRELLDAQIDIFIHNAGAYSIPRHKCYAELDNVFCINFVSPYYIIKTLLPSLRERGGKVVAVGSIAHNYSKSDAHDIDFATRKQASKVYGNAKRYLTFSLFELFGDETDVTLSITHPGIAFTNITAHYPPLIFALIKHPMKIIFMKPKKAVLSILSGVFDSPGYFEWIGPRLFDVWGLPKKKRMHTCSQRESREIFERAERIYEQIK
jgi:NAD(P)-dependent dehydrogenase (short-subunit alcohol dehydrogenase family)